MSFHRSPFGEQGINLGLDAMSSPEAAEAASSPETKSSEAF